MELPLLNALSTRRWSPRIFDATRSVPRGHLLSCFEAARRAPSSYNDQPWLFVYAHRDTPGDGYAKLCAALVDENSAWATTAPVIGVVAAHRRNPRDGGVNRYAEFDCGQAMAHFTFQATHLSLFVHQMGGFDRTLAAEAAQLSPDVKALAMFVVGYRSADPHSDASLLTEAQKRCLAAENPASPRNPLESIAMELGA